MRFPSRLRPPLPAALLALGLLLILSPACREGLAAPAVQAEVTAAPRLASAPTIRVTPAADTLQPGDSVQLRALSAYGSTLTRVTWASRAPAVASVSTTGRVRALAPGVARVVAVRSSGDSAAAMITVPAPPAPEPVPPPPAPGALYADGFERAEVQASGNGFAWTGPAYVSTSAERARTGTRSLKFRFGPLGDKPVTEQSRAQLNFTFPRSSEVWLEWYAYYPTGREGISGVGAWAHGNDTPDNNKLLRVYADGFYSKAPEWGASTVGQTYGGGGNARVRVDAFLAGGYAGGNILPAGSLTLKPLVLDTLSDRGRWVRLRFHGRKASAGGSDGLVRIWKDDALVLEQRGLALRDATGGHDWFSAGYLYGAANSGFPRATAVYVDDFRIYRADPGW